MESFSYAPKQEPLKSEKAERNDYVKDQHEDSDNRGGHHERSKANDNNRQHERHDNKKGRG